MKKNFLSIAAAFALIIGFVTTLTACDVDRHIAPSKLPKSSQSFIAKYFPDCSIIDAEYVIDREGYNNEKYYDVELDCGVDIEFIENGDWKSIESDFAPIPDEIIPNPILTYVKDNYPNTVITAIDKERYGYKVDLNTDLDLIFDKDGKFVRTDR